MKARYHIPSRAAWQDEPPSDEKTRLERAIFLAIERAVKTSAPQGSEIVVAEIQGSANASERFASSRYRPGTGAYSVPSYQNQGALVGVSVVSFEPERITLTPDRVIEEKPPFHDATVLALPGNHYVKIQAHRYATTTDLAHAVIWGSLLFGTTTWAIVSQPKRSGELRYYVAGLSERLTEADLRVQPFDSSSRPVPDATGAFFGRVLPSLPGDYVVESVYFPDGGRTAPTRGAFTGFAERLTVARQEPHVGFDPALVRATVFGVIDSLLATGKDADLERAADLLAELNVVAFSLLDAQTRARYLSALVRAWTSDPQEKAIVEIFKSVTDATELQTVIQMLKRAGLSDQLFDDLDNALWSLLVTLGERFGDKLSLSFVALELLLLESQLIPFLPSLRRSGRGFEVSVDVMAEAYEAARGFLRFVGGFLESLWTLVAHPDKLIDAVGQLAKMSLTVQLAQLGDPDSIKAIEAALAGVSMQARYALQGVAVAGVSDKVIRRVKWAIILEVASWFVGFGEIKAAAEGLGLGEKLAAIARFLGLLRLTEKTAEGAKVATKLQALARLVSGAGKAFQVEEEALRLLSRLPSADVTRLAVALEKAEVHEGVELAKLLETHVEIKDALRKAAKLGDFSKRAGGLTDDVAEAFARLSSNGRMSPDEIGALLYAIPEGQLARFARVVRSIPPSAFAPGGTASPALLDLLAESPVRMNAMLEMGFDTFAAIQRRAGNEAKKLDEYLQALAELDRRLPMENRAIERRRLLDQLERGDAGAWLELEDARTARFAPADYRLDPAVVERWIEQELDRLGPLEPAVEAPLDLGRPPPIAPASARAPVRSFKDALAQVDLSGMPPATRARIEAGWRRYRQNPARKLKRKDDYIRYVYGRQSGQWPEITRDLSNLGRQGGVEQAAGLVLQKVVDARLPPGSANVRPLPTPFGNTVPDHLPPGTRTVRLNSKGALSTTPSDAPFSAAFVGDSKYRNVVPTNDQTRGFAHLASYSDQKRLVFYVRWRQGFPDASTMLVDSEGVGRLLPSRFLPEIVQSGLREEARRAGVTIELVSDPLWAG